LEHNQGGAAAQLIALQPGCSATGALGAVPMADAAIPYPPAPPNVPAGLTAPTTSYRARVLVVLASLFVFAFLYLGLVLGSAYLCYWSFAPESAEAPETSNGLNVLRDVGRNDERLTTAYNKALRDWQQNKILDNEFVKTLDNDLLPSMRDLRQRLAQTRGLGREEQRLFDQYGKVLLLQEESWELLGQAVSRHDARLSDKSRQKARESDQLASQVSADAERYYGRGAPRKSESRGWIVILGILSGFLFLFLVKGFFKWRLRTKTQRLEVTPEQEPVLFAFIYQICRDTRAPLPHRVYLTPDVNAAVFYRESVLSLVVPTRKNLLIGLGLVNQVNLSEFKAVLAHEFGHFSQNSMKLGNYVYTCNRVIADIVFGRDKLDDFVAALCRIDIRIAVFAWGFSGILWGLRKTLEGLFRTINFANSSLSRQMEFNADLVAVSVTGSDALVHCLARTDFAANALSQAWSDLGVAADHQHFTRDLFYHQTHAAEYLRVLSKNPRLGVPPPVPEDPGEMVQVFAPEDISVPKMWATHPSNHDREVNAKRTYVRGPIDERSPWILFQDAAALRTRVTLRAYQDAHQLQEEALEAPEVVQAFIDEEHAETTYHPRYHGLYDNRYLTPGSLDELIQAVPAEFAAADHLAEAHARLYGDEVKARMEAHQARQEDFRRVAPLAQGAVELKGKDFAFRGSRYRAAEAGKLLEKVKQEIQEDFEWMGHLDRQAFLVHFSMARLVSDEARRELEERYRFHLAVQEIHSRLSNHNQQVQRVLSQISGMRELTQEDFRYVLDVLGESHDELRQLLEAAAQMRLPLLKNVAPGEPLGPVLLRQPLIRGLGKATNRLDGEWIRGFMEQLGEVLNKAQRIHFKSLGGVLALQDRLAEQWPAPGRVAVAPVASDGVNLEGP
jgi:Zn-dependent protease with chaperone function